MIQKKGAPEKILQVTSELIKTEEFSEQKDIENSKNSKEKQNDRREEAEH